MYIEKIIKQYIRIFIAKQLLFIILKSIPALKPISYY